GSRIVTKWGGTTILQDVLGTGGRVGFIADQNAGDDGLFVPFFNKLASSYKSIAILAMRYRAPVVVALARRIGAEIEYELIYTDMIMPEDWDAQPDPIFYITARFNRGLEQAVQLAPEQYLWIHRRWKSRPKFEREGKPMPARMAEKLRSLPWITEANLEIILERSRAQAAQIAESAVATSPQLPEQQAVLPNAP
ncbi:MAG TPA: lysophospholipid acyltransferase family protein, partial [Phycisphaerales bacterium]|nr:lysophospholipid acyltransferase family protein [Phycisphaerales bacterium]